MAQKIIRTAILTIHNPTRHARAALDTMFRDYTAAYTECLHACERQYDAEKLLELATYASKTGQPRRSARALSKRLFSAEQAPAVARVYAAAAAPLENRLRQSLREHLAQTLLSYATLYQDWSDSNTQQNDQTEQDEKQAQEQTTQKPRKVTVIRAGMPRFPKRLHPCDLAPVMSKTLEEFALLADNPVRERELRAQLQRTRQAEVISVPLVGLDADYGGGLYVNCGTNRFYARLDIVGASSHLGRPITAEGCYTDIKTQVVTVSKGSETLKKHPDAATFGLGKKSILVPLEMGRWHEQAQRWSVVPNTDRLPVAYLPQRGDESNQLVAAKPKFAKIVRRADPKRSGNYRYELHVSFSIPAPISDATIEENERPLLAINRGIYHLYTAVVTTPDASQALECQAALGEELLALQYRLEQRRQERQQRGVASAQAVTARHVPARDHRQRRITDQHCIVAANEITALARRHNAQVVLEDLKNMRNLKPPRHLQPILRARQFEKLAKLIAERLEVSGLPPARTVSAYYISLDCPGCGARQDAKEVAKSDQPDQFICQHCAETLGCDVVAAANIARRFAWIQQRSAEKKAGVPDEQRLKWESFANTHPVRIQLLLS